MLLSRMLASFHIWGLLVVIRQWDVTVSMAMPPGRGCFPTCFYHYTAKMAAVDLKLQLNI